MRFTRIRKDMEIVGYLRHDLTHTFFTKDFFWWTGEIPGYIQEDQFSELKDSKGRRLFEHDIVNLHFQSMLEGVKPYRIARRSEKFFLLDLSSNKRIALNSPLISSVDFLSYTFLNPEIVFQHNVQ